MHARGWGQRELIEAFTILGKGMWGGFVANGLYPKWGGYF